MSWERVSLADVAEQIQYGYTASATDEAIGPKFLRITDIVPDSINWDTVPYCPITEKDAAKYKIEKGDIVIARTGNTTGYAKLIRQDVDAVFASYLIRIKLNTQLADPGFVGRLVESPSYKAFVDGVKGGAAQGNANAKTLALFSFKLPSLPVQQKIAGILSAYDDLIDNNRKRIALLEKAARLQYEEWFVRLQFPGHEHTPVVAGVPQGWEKVLLPDAVDINPRTKVAADGEKWFVEMSRLSNSSMVISEPVMKEGNSGSKFKNHDTLLARITPCLENGKTGYVNFLKEDESGFGSTEFIVLRGKKVPSQFVYCLARTEHFRGTAITSMVGSSGRQRVQTAALDDYEMLLPTKGLLDIFEATVKPAFEAVRVLSAQTQKLQAARDLLLPRLMSGELAV